MRIFYDGGKGGANLLPPGSDVLVNWNLFNSNAINWLKKYGYQWLFGINETSREQVVNIFDSWLRSGQRLDALETQLKPIYGAERAEMIATTEVTRIYGEGNLSAWQATGIVGAKKWQTCVDDRVCEICAPLHNKMVNVDEGWSMDESGEIIPSFEGILSPPAHVR